MAITCLCQLGPMAKCTAKCREDELTCSFENTSSVADRCCHRIEAIGNHCDCVKAQKFARTGIVDDVEEEIEIDINLLEDPEDILEMVTSCATCENCNSMLYPTCKIQAQKNEVDQEMRLVAACCDGFELTASCVMCKFHDDCHDGRGPDHYSLSEKINIAQTCKKYDPITNTGPDDIPF